MKRSNKFIISTVIIIETILIIFFIGLFFTANEQTLNGTVKKVQSMYVEQVEEQTLYEGMLKGMMESLNDPHSIYMTAEEAKKFNQQLASSFSGIGVAISQTGETITVTKVFEGSPAELGGVTAGDQVTHINGESISGLTTDEITTKIKGPNNTQVMLTLNKNGTTEDVTLTRAPIEVKSVSSEMIDQENKIGYIKIDSFSEDTSNQFAIELAALEAAGMKVLLIDVRNDGGGYLNALEGIVNQIVPNTAPYLIIDDQKNPRQEFTSTLTTPKEYEIIGIQNSYTASASEILMGALKEVNGSKIIGTTTYGKGSVQTTFPVLYTGGIIKLTIQY